MSGQLPGQVGWDGSFEPFEPESLFPESQLPPPVPRNGYRGQCAERVRGGGPCGRFLRADGLCDQPSRHVPAPARCEALAVKGQRRPEPCGWPLNAQGRCDRRSRHWHVNEC